MYELFDIEAASNDKSSINDDLQIHPQLTALMIAAQENKIEEVKNLIAQREDVDFEVDNESAASLAFARGHHEVVLALLKANAKIPHNYQNETSSKELKNFVELSVDLHARIRVEKIQEILTKNSNLKYFYDLKNNSLMKNALEGKKFSIFKLLWENNLKLAPHEDVWEILKTFHDFEMENFRKIQLINFEDFPNLKNNLILSYCDIRGFNALMIAAENNHIEAVDFCLREANFILNYSVNSHTAASLAFSRNNFEILFMLLDYNAQFPPNFTIDGINHENLEKFVKMSLEVHFYIDLNLIEKVHDLIKENSKLIYFYDLSNRSAFRHAVEDKKFEIYKLLVENFVSFGPHENYDAMRRQLTEDEQLKMTQIQFELSDALTSPTILTLISHSFVGHESRDERRSIAMEAFQFLSKNERIEIILKIVATQKNFQIVFDFNRDTIQILDATAELYMNGSFYTNGRIYIAAKKFYHDEDKFEALAALAHELCHFAVFVTFGNNAKPYRSDNDDNKLIYNQVIEECRNLAESEEIVHAVYRNYSLEMQPAELIVRPVHMSVFYHGLSILNEKEEVFKSLYDFYDEKCVKEMNRVLPGLEAIANYTEKDEKIDKLKHSNLMLGIMILLVSIFAISIGIIFYNPFLSWSDLSPKDRMTIKNANVTYHNVNVKFHELFANDSNVYDLLSPNEIRNTLDGNTNDLSTSIRTKFDPYIFLMWHNMSQSLKNKFIKSKVNFQGRNISFDNFLNEKSPLSFLNSFEVREIFNGNKFIISSPVEINLKVYIERYFIEESLDIFSELQNVYHIEEEPFYLAGMLNLKNGFIINVDEIIESLNKDQKVVLLSSYAGDGKTTVFRHFGRILKEKYPWKWIQFVSLNHYTKIFEENKNLMLTDLNSLIEFLGRILFKLNDFEVAIFGDNLKTNNVILIWDGVDEIAPYYLEFFINLTLKVKELTKNIQFISTRPQHSDTLKINFSELVMKLIPFSLFNGYEYLVKLLSIEVGLKSKQDSIFDQLSVYYKLHSDSYANLTTDLNFIENTSKKLQIDPKDFQNILNRIYKAKLITDALEINYLDKYYNLLEMKLTFSNPLLVSMIGDFTNDENFLSNASFNIYNLYEYFIEKKIKIVLKKGDIVESDFVTISKMSTLNIMQVHQIYALKLIFKTYDFISKLSIMKLMHKLSNEQISRFGILLVQFDDDFDFTHRTFAEFLVVQYLVDNLDEVNFNSKEGRLKMLMFSEIILDEAVYAVQNSFLRDYMTTKVTASPLLKYWYEIDVKFKNYNEQFEELRLLDIHLSHYLQTNFNATFDPRYSIKLNCFDDYSEKFLKSSSNFSDIFGDEMLRYALTYSSIFDGQGILKGDHQNIDILKLYFDVLLEQNNFTHDDIRRLLVDVKFNDSITLTTVLFKATIIDERSEDFLRLIETHLTVEERKEVFKIPTYYMTTALTYSIFNNEKAFKIMVNAYRIYTPEEIRKYILNNHPYVLPFVFNVIDNYHSKVTFAQEAGKFLRENFENEKIKLRKYLSHRNEDGDSLFSRFILDVDYEKYYKEKLEVFIDLLRETFDNKEEFEEYFKLICEKKIQVLDP